MILLISESAVVIYGVCGETPLGVGYCGCCRTPPLRPKMLWDSLTGFPFRRGDIYIRIHRDKYIPRR
jgi:hypothetical protein